MRDWIRNLGEAFLVHLCDFGLYKEVWAFDELRRIYYDYLFPDRVPPFNQVLYQLSSYSPVLLHLGRGKTVIFKTEVVHGHYWSELMRRDFGLIFRLACFNSGAAKTVSKNHFVFNLSRRKNLEHSFLLSVTNARHPLVLFKTFKIFDGKNALVGPSKSNINCHIGHGGRFLFDLHCSELQSTKLIFRFAFIPENIPFSLGIAIDYNISTSIVQEVTKLKTCSEISPSDSGIPVFHGVKPILPGSNEMIMRIPLKPWLAHRGIMTKCRTGSILQSKEGDLLKNTLCKENYCQKFHLLLYLEELQYIEDIKQYGTTTVLSRKGDYLTLSIPGLAEKRPSILRGDRIFVRKVGPSGDAHDAMYEGFVHQVEQTEVLLKFNEKLHNDFVPRMSFEVDFAFNRNPLKLMHRAVELASGLKHLLFPKSQPRSRSDSRKLQVKNQEIEKNRHQLAAVEAITDINASPVYVIYGPPGTGKTVTMVEAIIQTLLQNEDYNMLVCAPSNSACDLLTVRLRQHVEKRNILRMHAPSRISKDIPQEIMDVSNVNTSGEIYFAPRDILMNIRVLVCTLITAGRLASAQFPDGHFNRIFIDESGQSMEPELMVTVSGILATDGKLILAGDPKQLGPIVRSTNAKTHGLQLSLLERLMSHPAYQKQSDGKYNEMFVTKLVKNYRSHECIIKISNEEFYENELEVCANFFMRSSLCQLEELPQKNFPIIFKDVRGKDEREKRSPSFCNMLEVKQVKAYVETLLSGRRYSVKPKEIGIITPYRKQVHKLRECIKNKEIKVGSVEEFQGQERRVIIISTVRSTTANLKHDARFHLGFVCDPKRFNVALTRAKSLLIIVGNAELLCMDKYWRKLHNYCCENNAYIGRSVNKESSLDLQEFFTADIKSEIQVGQHDDLSNPEWRLNP